jgi:GH25 family lysozyme M1 (1,4-beta-N-acetylmuramidase)/putative cell wall-binding protein
MKTGLAVLAAAILTVVAVVPAIPAAADEATPTAPSTATAAPSPAPASTPVPTPTVSPTESATGPQAPAGDPGLAEMNATGNHTMGSTIPSSDPASGSGKTSRFSASLGVSGVLGMDVSGWQTGINWPSQYAAGARFAYIKASEGTDYTSSQFSTQYSGSYSAGLIRGAYHFATPNTSTGAVQARYFVANGGGWSPDGRTLPPLLDIEYDPYTGTDHTNSCWGLSTIDMSNWIYDFVSTVQNLTGVRPAIYSTANWWNTCTGSNNTFGAYPLFVARYGTSTPGALPASWVNWTIWQFADAGTFAGDQDIFNGTMTQLTQFALGAQNYPPIGSYDTATLASGSSFSVSGWAFDQTNLAAPVQVQISWNTPSGITQTTVTANQSRPDVASTYPGVGNYHGFTAQVPWSGNGQYGACITVIALPGDTAGNASLGCKTSFFSPASATIPPSQRLAGTDRFDTAVKISQHAFPNPGVPVVYVASGMNFPDALSAATAAGAQHGPVLLAGTDSVPSGTIAELNRLQPAKIIVVGGTSAIDATAYAQLAALNRPLQRIGGADRFETSRLIANYAFPNATSAFVATGSAFADALTAAPVAAKKGVPLLLIDGAAMDPGTASYLTSRPFRSVTLVGGATVIAQAWADSVTSAGISATRIGGATRFDTSSALVSAGFANNSSSSAYVASGYAWQDALVAGAAAGATSQPLLLAASTCIPRTIGDQFVRLGTSSFEIAGGTNVLSSGVDAFAVCY